MAFKAALAPAQIDGGTLDGPVGAVITVTVTGVAELLQVPLTHAP